MTRISRQEQRRKDADLQRHIDTVIADTKAERDAVHKAAKEAAALDRATEGTITREHVTVGSLIRDQFGWRRVLKVNTKTVTVPSMHMPTWTDAVRYERIREVRPAPPTEEQT